MLFLLEIGPSKSGVVDTYIERIAGAEVLFEFLLIRKILRIFGVDVAMQFDGPVLVVLVLPSLASPLLVGLSPVLVRLCTIVKNSRADLELKIGAQSQLNGADNKQ